MEILHESEEGANLLIDELLKGQIVETLVQQALMKLSEQVQDESDGIQNALTVIENVKYFRRNWFIELIYFPFSVVGLPSRGQRALCVPRSF